MFNETTYQLGSLGRTPECEAIKANCDTRFPVASEDLQSPEMERWWNCMKATGYETQCMDNKSYSNPSATAYPLDIFTNSQNPNFVFQLPDFFKLADGSTNWFLLGGIGLLVFAVVMKVR